MALQQKDMEEYYDQLSTFKQDEKQLRVKVNQLEVELEHNLKRLDIICKSKGLPRPQRKFSNASGASGTGAGRYVSPYGQRGGPSSNNGSATKPGGIRNLSNNSGTKRPSPLRNFQYTPPNKRNQSPGAYSQNSTGQNNKFRSSPMNNGYSNNTQTSLRNRQQSPGAKSIGSNKSTGSATKPTQNRLYSPSGRIRTNSGTQNTNNNTGLYGSGGNGVNRVRREPAVGGNTSNSNLNNSQNSFNSRSNSRTRVNSGLNNSGSGVVNNRSGSNNRNGSGVKSSGYGPATNKPSSTYQRKSSSNVGSSIYGRQNNNQNQNQNERKATLFSNNKSSSIYSSNQQKSSSSMILDQQKASQQNGTIDEKIEKLQNILKQAKQNL